MAVSGSILMRFHQLSEAETTLSGTLLLPYFESDLSKPKP